MTRVRLDLGRLLGFRLTVSGRNHPAGAKIGTKPPPGVLGADLGVAIGSKIGGKPVF